MPVHTGSDAQGSYAQWGSKGKKYRYKAGDSSSMTEAKKKAGKQGEAAYASGYKGK